MYYGWSKEILEAGKRRLAGDTARALTSDEDLRHETQAEIEAVADPSVSQRLVIITRHFLARWEDGRCRDAAAAGVTKPANPRKSLRCAVYNRHSLLQRPEGEAGQTSLLSRQEQAELRPSGAEGIVKISLRPLHRGHRRRRKSFSISRAALCPGAPVTPPPGWVEAPHM